MSFISTQKTHTQTGEKDISLMYFPKYVPNTVYLTGGGSFST